MACVNVMPSLQVADLAPTEQWYERLFGRPADRRPMDGCVEWHLADSGGLQVYENPGGAVASTIILGVDDVDTTAAELAGRGIDAQPEDVPSGQFRLAQLTDPAGNTVVISQSLT